MHQAAGKPKQVLFTRSDVRLAGPGRLMIAQAEALRERGVDIVFATGGGELAQVAQERGFDHHEIPELRVENRSIRATAIAVRSMSRLIASVKPCVVHAFNAHAALCATPAATRRRAPVFSSVTGRGKERILPFLPVRYIAVSEFVRDGLIANRVPSKRISVIPNATITEGQVIDDAQLAELETARRDAQMAGRVHVCGVAMFTGGKGQDVIIDVLAELKKRGEERVHATFVGDGPALAQCRLQAQNLGVGDSCEFVGAQHDVQPYLDEASIFMHFSREETFGLVLAEAGARGLPVVTHNVGGIPEVVIDGTTGIVVDYLSVVEAADALQRLIDAPDEQRRLGRQGRDRVRSNYLSEVSADNLLMLYRAHAAQIGDQR